MASSPILSVLMVAILSGGPSEGRLDVARLSEMLHDGSNPAARAQAALLLVQHESRQAERVVREELRRIEDADSFVPLATAIELERDRRFDQELLDSLASPNSKVRESAGDVLARLSDAELLKRLEERILDFEAPLAVRRQSLRALAKSGRKQAVTMLIRQLESDQESLRSIASDSLESLAGTTWGADSKRWRAWWTKHESLREEEWLALRLAHQASRASRLETALNRARGQVTRLQQRLYAQLPPSERVGHIETASRDEEAEVRLLAVGWIGELFDTVDPGKRGQLVHVLLRLTRDPSMEVRRASVLLLGRESDEAGFDRLRQLCQRGVAPVRAAAVRSLAQLARGKDDEAKARRKIVVPLLQKALLDPSLEVVVEAAEDLGALGVPEAGPVLVDLLRHSSASVRRAAAQALERVADRAVLESILGLPSDSDVTVRFALVGALGRIAGNGAAMSPEQLEAVQTRLVIWFQKDTDAGVRSRAATALGECGSAKHLPLLAECLSESEDVRVQEKAWSALVRIVVKTQDEALLKKWDAHLAKEKQGQRRVQLLAEAFGQWQEGPTRAIAFGAQQLLIRAQLDLGKWASALPLIRDALSRPGSEAEKEERVGWLLESANLALDEGKRDDVKRLLEEARPHVPAKGASRTRYEAVSTRLVEENR